MEPRTIGKILDEWRERERQLEEHAKRRPRGASCRILVLERRSEKAEELRSLRPEVIQRLLHCL